MDADKELIDSEGLRAGCPGHVKECGRLAHAAEARRKDKPQINWMDADKELIDSEGLRAGCPGHVKGFGGGLRDRTGELGAYPQAMKLRIAGNQTARRHG
jgi:hypothetical protein